MIKISEECAKSLEHLVKSERFEKLIGQMFELNPHLADLILAIYDGISFKVLINDPDISIESLEEIKIGIGFGVSYLYQLVRIQLESNELSG